MYHRVAIPQSDVWELSVSPQNFEQHLQFLKASGNVISLEKFGTDLLNEQLDPNSIVITFDDGYIDNLEVAMPLLEKYELPATFFITSAHIDTNKEFWWDELEELILFTKHLPHDITININKKLIQANLADEATLDPLTEIKHRTWKACTEEPPTKRAKLFYHIWEQLKFMCYDNQQEQLKILRTWANIPFLPRDTYRTITSGELKQLASGQNCVIGAHSLTHIALAKFTYDIQFNELTGNKNLLQQITGKEINLVSYPYGSNNDDTLKISAGAGFTIACSTNEKSINAKSNPHQLGRFQVKNMDGKAFSRNLKKWTLS